MYFLTAVDPNYSIKGSRDPLGFQVIWQEAGRQLIPHLSTVSSSIKDFQVLCFANALKHHLSITDNDFPDFFIRFEQLMAYIRFTGQEAEGFNGIDRVRKIMATNPRRIAISNSDQLLSNQRSYGVWGKYSRPFLDARMHEDPHFNSIFMDKMSGDFISQAASVKKATGGTTVPRERLENFTALFKKPTGKEKAFFVSHLLRDNCDNEMLKITAKHNGFREMGLSLYQLIETASNTSEHERYKLLLKNIKNIELALSPLNSIFRYLQTRSFWPIDELENDVYITNWRTTPDVISLPEELQPLASQLQSSNTDLIKALLKRNEMVCARRGGTPWLRFSSSGLEVNYFDGGGGREDYDPLRDHHNNYFLSSFISIYNQLN